MATDLGRIWHRYDAATKERPWLLLLPPLALALVWRLAIMPSGSFPMNDGALFYAFAQAIAANGLSLPTEVAFNGQTLPFAYPPFGFWVAALLHALGFDLLTVFRWLPLAVNLGYCAAVMVLFRRLSDTDRLWLLAAVIFVLSPRSFEWLIMGGGMARGFGALFTVLAWVWVDRWLAGRRRRDLILAGLFTGLAILSHLEWGLIAAAGVTLMALTRIGLRAAIVPVAAVGIVSFLVMAPWFFWVLSVHGLAPFQAASGTSEWHPIVSLHKLASVQIVAWFIVMPALLGAIVEIRAGRWFWTALLVTAAFLTPRHVESVSVLAASFLAASGIVALADWIKPRLPQIRDHVQFPLLAGAASLWVAIGCLVTVYGMKSGDTVDTVGADGQAFYAWARELDEPQDFVFVSPARWMRDDLAEWFPVMTHHRAVNLVQGTEWLEGAYKARNALHEKIRATADAAPEVLPSVMVKVFASPEKPYLIVVDQGIDYFSNDNRFIFIKAFGALRVYKRAP